METAALAPGALTEHVLGVARAAGIDEVGIAPAAPFLPTRVELHRRKDAGLHGGMNFTYRNPERSTDPGATVDDARSLVVGAARYLRAAPDAAPDRPRARVARYAWGDRYEPLRRSLGEVAEALRAAGHRAVVACDDNALVDREAAHRAGIGWYGKNANLLLPGKGSWFVLGAVITDAPLVAATRPVPDGCGACTRCIPACPTGAIVAPGVVDARRCLAWLLQAEGDFPVEHRAALGDRIYGCDDCQEVCPPNVRAARTDPPGPADAGDRPTVDVLALLALDDDSLLRAAGSWYVARRDARYLRRNLLVVLGNTGDGGDARVVAALRAALGSDDELVRSHARWAASRLGVAA